MAKINKDKFSAIIDKMFDLQDSLNKKIHPEWKTQNFDWHTAILVEVGELIDSLNWKWWKSQPINYENIKVELVDIFHFIMSLALENKETADIFKNTLMHSELSVKSDDFEQDKFIEYCHELIVTTSTVRNYRKLTKQSYNDDILIFWIILWNLAGYPLEDIFKEYFIKNTLNKFRQNHGYKDGDYKKIWVYDTEDDVELLLVEDNKKAYELASQIPLDENFSETLYSQLEQEYKTQM